MLKVRRISSSELKLLATVGKLFSMLFVPRYMDFYDVNKSICFSSGMVQSVGANLSPDQTFGSIRSLSVTREVASFPLSRTPTPPPQHRLVIFLHSLWPLHAPTPRLHETFVNVGLPAQRRFFPVCRTTQIASHADSSQCKTAYPTVDSCLTLELPDRSNLHIPGSFCY